MLERGVRHVQLFSSGSFGSSESTGMDMKMKQSWTRSLRIDQPVAALIKDLKSRGMLDETLVMFTSEFGRTPFTQSASDKVGTGRDPRQVGFSVWLAGGGSSQVLRYGATR